jgi:Carboxypeptidase regulatory-like domain
MNKTNLIIGALLSVVLLVPAAFGQANGTLRGTVTLDTAGAGQPARGVTVTVLRINRSAVTGDDGTYEISEIPAGNYSVVAHLDGVPDIARIVEINGATTADFQLRLRGVTQQVTVTATGDRVLRPNFGKEYRIAWRCAR